MSFCVLFAKLKPQDTVLINQVDGCSVFETRIAMRDQQRVGVRKLIRHFLNYSGAAIIDKKYMARWQRLYTLDMSGINPLAANGFFVDVS